MTITTGLKSLDDLIGGGLQPGSLTLYAGTSQSGMTTLLDTTVTAAALNDSVPTLLADLESGDRQSRILSAYSGVRLAALQRGALSDDDMECLARSFNVTASAPLHHAASRDMPYLLAEAMEAKAALVAIDGVRYVKSGPGDHDDVAQVLMSLKDLARSQGAAVVVTAPINRDDVRPGNRPSLTSLPAEFGLNCDTVVLIERWGSLGGPESTPEPAELIVPKNRYGGIGQVSVLGDYTHARFLDCEPLDDAKAA